MALIGTLSSLSIKAVVIICIAVVKYAVYSSKKVYLMSLNPQLIIYILLLPYRHIHSHSKIAGSRKYEYYNIKISGNED